MPKAGPRQYVSQLRGQSAEATRLRILESAKSMFARRGIDDTTIAEIAERAGVAGSTIYALYKSKEGILRERDTAAFEAWLTAAQATALHGFVTGIVGDLAAVRAALSQPWSNGPVEGQINRLKLLKRQAYGRAKFDLLRSRVLHAA